jgi:hypothetical protein
MEDWNGWVFGKAIGGFSDLFQETATLTDKEPVL